MMFISHIFVNANKNQYRFLFVFLKLIFRFGTVLMSSLDVQKWISLLFFETTQNQNGNALLKNDFWFIVYFSNPPAEIEMLEIYPGIQSTTELFPCTHFIKKRMFYFEHHTGIWILFLRSSLCLCLSLTFSKSCWMFVCADARVRRTFTFFPFFGLRFKEISVDIFRFTSYTCFVAFAVEK